MATNNPMRLDCPICKKKMTEPTAFRCLHFFCQTCVDDIKETTKEAITGYKCPICDDITPKEDVTIMDYVAELLNDNGQVNGEEKMCNKCKTEIPTERCLDCKESFCKRCRDHHDGFQILKHHKWQELSDCDENVIDRSVFCKHHSDECIRFHCKDCQNSICVTCIDATHKGHTFETIESRLEELKPEIIQCKEGVENVIRENENSLAEAISHAEDLKKKYEDLEQAIDKRCEELIKEIRTDGKRAKEEIALIKENQIDKLEEYIKELELRLKSGINTVTLTNATLQRAKNASMLNALNINIKDRLNRSLNEKLSGERRLMPIKATFVPRVMKENAPFIFGDITGKIWPSTYIHHKLTTLCSLKTTLGQSVKMNYEILRFAQIDDELCGLQLDSNIIHFHSKECKELKAKTIPNAGIIYSLAQADDGLLVAASTGLYLISQPEDKILTIMTEETLDVAIRDEIIYALNNRSEQIKTYKYDSRADAFNQVAHFDIAHYQNNTGNTIQVTQDYIYIAEYSKHHIRKYDHNGTLIATIGTQGRNVGQLNEPRICGSDVDGSLLIADNNINNRLQVLTSDGNFQEIRLEDLSSPFHATFVNDKLLVLQIDDVVKYYTFH